MSRFTLLGGAYTSDSLIAAAQRCINLFPESVPKETKEGVEAVHLLRPGRRLLSQPPAVGRGRGLFCLTNGDLYAVIDNNLYYIDPDWNFHPVFQLKDTLTSPVHMADNGTNAVLVDGTINGYNISMATRTVTQIGDPNFLGANWVDFLDTFLAFNEPNSPNYYLSLSNQISFNALDFATKTAWPDDCVGVLALEKELWVMGKKKGEIWYNAGSAGFPFQASAGVIIEHGLQAIHSMAKQDVRLYWLSQSPEGGRLIMKSDGHAAKRISKHSIENELKKYPRVDDAIGGCFQIIGHAFYCLHFPAADKTWVYDESTDEWHEEAFCDTNGVLHRMRDCFYANAYDVNVSLDWTNGNLYTIDTNFYYDQLTKDGTALPSPIVWIRSLPHSVADKFERITYNWLIADCEVGTGLGTQDAPLIVSPWSSGFSPGFGPLYTIEPPLVSLRYSDDRGASFGNKITQLLGAQGEYNTTVTWWNLGMARDRVFELSGATIQKFSLLGVFGDYELHET